MARYKGETKGLKRGGRSGIVLALRYVHIVRGLYIHRGTFFLLIGYIVSNDSRAALESRLTYDGKPPISHNTSFYWEGGNRPRKRKDGH